MADQRMTGEDLSRMSDARALRYLAKRLGSKFANKLEVQRLVQIAAMLEVASLAHADACRLSRVFCHESGPSSDQDIRINEWLKDVIRNAPDHPHISQDTCPTKARDS